MATYDGTPEMREPDAGQPPSSGNWIARPRSNAPAGIERNKTVR
ncbi:hypothetical protein [Thauera sinica]|uniref:Uncharacterized protein n=1 Tax=Thauera sinica TaxID=2665146 RepID=A0ABW1ALT7_9RHOO|nr:hypothetical protein [Thauera sp. K11]